MNGLKKSDNRKVKPLVVMLACSLLIASCYNTHSPTDSVPSTAIEYAKRFRISHIGKTTLVEIIPFENEETILSYQLVPKGTSAALPSQTIPVIPIPIETIVCTSTTHIPLLDYLNETDKLIGFPTTDYISSKQMRRRIDAGLVKDLGIDKSLNIEALYALKPSVVMGYTVTNDLGQTKKIQELGIPVIINAEYLENHPLGRAEWIKLMALLLGKEKEADSVFSIIKKEYLSARDIAQKATTKPTVFSGMLYGGSWFMPGGKNFAAQLLADAGCHYLWASDSSNSFLQKDFESVYAFAKTAQYWIGVGSYLSLQEMERAEGRYTLFYAFQKHRVFGYNARIGATGGNEFLELGYLRPDFILKDLVKILHPELLPTYNLFFYNQLH